MIIEHFPINYKNIHLAIMPRPRAGDWIEEEFQSFKNLDFDILVSLLTREEQKELNLLNEKSEAEKQGLIFYNFPIIDRSIPENKENFLKLIHELTELLKQGKGIGVHCRMGIGRAGLTCSAILMYLGETYKNAMKIVSDARRLFITDHESQIDFLANIEMNSNGKRH